MLLIFLGLALVTIWAFTRLGRQTEKAGRGHWRITATILGAALFAGAIFALSRGSWLAGAGMALGGLWLVVQSRIRPVTAARPGAGFGPLMSLSEARATLGVSEGASKAEIQSAWKRLMARTHPDQGGTEGLAVRVNAARDRLLND